MMKEKIIAFFKRIGRIIRYWIWKRPISKPEPLKATEVIEHWTVIDYHGQRINLHKHEVPMFNALPRNDKRAMAKRFEIMEKKGQIKFTEIDGKMTCIYVRDYERRAEKQKAEESGK